MLQDYFTSPRTQRHLKKYSTGTRFSFWNTLLLKGFEDAFLSSVSILAVIDGFLPYTVAPENDKACFPCSNACAGAGQC